MKVMTTWSALAALHAEDRQELSAANVAAAAGSR
jgi:hypothetical protein